MNAEDAIVALASAAAVGALFVIAWGLGFRNPAKLESEEAARALIADSEYATRIEHLLLSDDGAAALARLADGRLAVVRRMGDRFSVRAFPAHAAHFIKTKKGVRVRFADLGFPSLEMTLEGAPPAWLALD